MTIKPHFRFMIPTSLHRECMFASMHIHPAVPSYCGGKGCCIYMMESTCMLESKRRNMYLCSLWFTMVHLWYEITCYWRCNQICSFTLFLKKRIICSVWVVTQHLVPCMSKKKAHEDCFTIKIALLSYMIVR